MMSFLLANVWVVPQELRAALCQWKTLCLSPGLQVHIYLKSVRAFVSEKLWRALQVVEFVVQLFFVKNLDTTPRLSPRFLCSSFSQYPRLQRDILWVCPQVFQKQTWPIVWFRFVTVRVRRLALPSAEHCVLCELVQNLSTACGSVMFACCVAGNVVGWKWTVLAVVSTSCTPSAKHFFEAREASGWYLDAWTNAK